MARPGVARWLFGLGLCSSIVAAVLACTERSAAAPADEPAKAPEANVATTEQAIAEEKPEPSVTHVVEEGETLWDIARAYGVKVETIQRASSLSARDARRLSKGTKLRIPGATQVVDVLAAKQKAAEAQVLPPLKNAAYHRLQRGESLWTVARTYDVPIEKLMERNALGDEDLPLMRIGQAVIVPGVKQSDVQSAEAKPSKGFVHEMAPGETVWDVARQFGVGVGEIMSANRMNEEQVTNIRDGTRIFLPGVEDDGKGPPRRRKTRRETRSLAIAKRLGLGTLRTAAALLHGRIEERWIRAADAAGRFPGTLRWPVTKGWFVRGYGSGAGGYHKAMDIAGEIGWNVRAAAPGVVGYSGDQVPGFGNMVMVIHPGGWVTLYAHNSVNFVVAGERVTRGGILAEVGSTGRSRGPHVHFELIHDNRNCDPAPLLRPGVKKRTGKLMRYEYTSWRAPDKRPRAVRCSPRQRHPQSQWVINENPTRDATGEAEHAPEVEAAPPEEP